MTPFATADAVSVPSPAVLSAERPLSPVDAHLAAAVRQRARRVVGVGLTLGLLGEVLFDGVPLGLSLAAFTAACLVGLKVLAGREGWQQAGRSRLVAVPMLFFAAMVGVRDSQTLTVANTLACLALAFLWAQFFNGERRGLPSGGALLLAPWKAAAFSIAAAPLTVLASVDSKEFRQGVGDHAFKVFRALFLTVPLLLVFAGLLMVGDPRFAHLVLSAFDHLDPDRVVSIGLYLLGGGLGLTGLLAHALRRAKPSVQAPVQGAQGPLGLSDALVPLVSLCALFGVFGLVRLQAVLTFDKYEAAAQAEFTYAKEAHQGFGALMAVVMLTLAVLLVFSRFTRLDSARQHRLFAGAGTALVVLTGPVLASGLSRLVLYQQMYGMTELRLYANWATLLSGALLVWRAVTLWRAQAAFGTGALTVALLALAGLNLYNPDLAIAEQNLNRSHAVVDVDPAYLATLSADAAPLVGPYLRQAGQQELFQRYAEEAGTPRGLWGWRWSRAQAAGLLAQ